VALFGATGLVARASGVKRDFRLQHPFGIYRWAVENAQLPNLETIVDSMFADPPGLRRGQRLITEERSGDVYSRTRLRIREVAQSGELIQELLQLLDSLPADCVKNELDEQSRVIEARIHDLQPYEFALGYVEGWRGDIVYWLMNDGFGRIYRCKVRDPSMLNWQALEAAVAGAERETRDPVRRKPRPLLPDFPLINKSFNLSYSGHDL
jgi:Ni,Fe-hydrogenase III large subunit